MARPDAGGIAGTGGVAGTANSNDSGGMGLGGTQVTGTKDDAGTGGSTLTTGTGGATVTVCPVGDAGTEMSVDTQTDNSHCGGCGNTCTALPPSTAQCAAGRCLVMLAKWQLYSYSLAVDESNVYWANGGTGWLMKVPQDGGDPVSLAYGLMRSIAVDATSIYWTDPGKPNPNFVAGTVRRMPIGGGIATALATGESPWNIAVDKTSVCWIDRGQFDDVFNTYREGSVMKVDLAGGAPTKLASTGRLPEIDEFDGDGTGTIAADATSVYWTDTDNDFDSVKKVPLAGGAVTTLAQGNYGLGHIAVDGTSVYWTTTGTGVGDWRDATVMKVPIEGGSPTVLAGGQAIPRSITVDGTSVYWTTASTAAGNYLDGNVMKAPLDGGPPTILVSGQSDPCSIAVDASSVYWLTSDGAVMRAYPK